MYVLDILRPTLTSFQTSATIELKIARPPASLDVESQKRPLAAGSQRVSTWWQVPIPSLQISGKSYMEKLM